MNRRNFLRNSAIAGTGLYAGLGQTALAQSRSANDTVNVALIGCRGHGYSRILSSHLKLPNVQCVALCDVDQNVLDERTAETQEIQGKAPKQYHDFRRLLEDKDVDAVIIGTPDHWHCIPFVYALQAGKDIFVEKPIANTIEECNIMQRAAKRYHKQVVQVGQQQNSAPHWRQIIADVQKGRIGQLVRVTIWANFNYGLGMPPVPNEPVPAGVDWDMWLGPAPSRYFNATRFHGKWRHFWDYGGGLLTDWGAHLIDMGLQAANVKTGPRSVAAYGGQYTFKDYSRETPDTLSVIWDMGDFTMTWEHTAVSQQGPYDTPYGVSFVGTKGTIVAHRGEWQLDPAYRDGERQMEAVPRQKTAGEAHLEHVKDFVSCVRSRELPVCTIDIGRLAALYAHLGNIAYRSGETLHYDEVGNTFGSHSEANRYITPVYRKPWELPQIS